MDYDEPQNVGHIFLALKPDLFISRKEFNSRMKTLGDRVHAVPLAHEFEEILMPGELEQRLEDERRANGIPYNAADVDRSEEHTSELQSLMRISYAVFCLKKKKKHTILHTHRCQQQKQ